MNLKHMSHAEVVSEAHGYEILKRTLLHEPAVERVSHETMIVAFYMREQSSQSEKQIDLIAGEGSMLEVPSGTQFRWLGEGVVEWPRTWVSGMRSSQVLGEMPERATRTLQYDFRNESKSSVFFHAPPIRSSDSFEFRVLQVVFYFDFKRAKLFINYE